MDIHKANKKIENLKNENKKLALMELERDDLLDKVSKMSINLENMTVTTEKMEEQEQRASSVTFENNKLTRQNQTLNRKLEEIELENKSLDSENQKLHKTIENLKSTARRVEQLEKENFELESNQHKLDRESKSSNKEIDRLRHDTDVKDVAIEELNSKLIGIERERIKLKRDLEQWNGEQSKVIELEQENRKLSQSCSMDKKTLIQLRHELVEEKIKFDNLSSDMEILQKKLQKIGIDVNSLEDDQNELQSLDRVKNLEGSMNRLLETRQRRIEMQDTQLKEMKEKNISLQQQLDVLQLKTFEGKFSNDAKIQWEETTEYTRILHAPSRNLASLKSEHSSLKEDFILLFSNREILKIVLEFTREIRNTYKCF